MKFLIEDVDNRKELEDKGLYVYDLRLGDNGDIATIEPNVWVNNCGNIITNEKIVFLHDEDQFLDFETFCSENEQIEDFDEF